MADPVSSCDAGDSAALAQRVTKIMDGMEEWCARLEDFADRLPSEVEAGECIEMSRDLCADICAAHEIEEKELFAALRRDPESAQRLEPTLARLEAEHLEDESLAQEIRESLADFAMNRKSCNVESLGYMLRGFFESKRRHCAFEREFLLPLLAPGQA